MQDTVSLHSEKLFSLNVILDPYIIIYLFLFQIHIEWPSKLRSKGVYFIKKENEKLPSIENESFMNSMVCGDIQSNILGNFFTFFSI